jgi:His/Glu/Gln/Arg/opine family amino acid ABC transporter permease subunit
LRATVPFDPSMMLRAVPVLLGGLLVTLELAGLAIVASLAWGLVIVLGRLSRFLPLAWLCAGYVQLVRNTPVLVQMYFFYFGFAMVGLRLSGFVAGLLALVLQNGGYVAEIYRAGIATVGRQQREAGLALGMRPLEALRIVVFPQALRLVLPPLANQFVTIVKDTALVSTLSVADMMFWARRLIDRTAAAYEIFADLTLLYLVLTASIAVLMRAAEWRLRVAD